MRAARVAAFTAGGLLAALALYAAGRIARAWWDIYTDGG